MQERTCTECGAQFNGRVNATACGPECRKHRRYRQTLEWSKRTGYHAKHRAKPEVAVKRRTREQAKGRAYRQGAKVASICIVCGAEWMADCKTKTRPVKYCSRACCAIDVNGGPRSAVPVRHPIRSTPVPRDHPSRVRVDSRPRFMAGRCPHCGTWYLADRLGFSSHADRACSKQCARRMSGARRRARERGAFVSNVDRHAVFIRDGWTCLLCGDPIERDAVAPHPLSASIDHVIPLARGGEHSMANVQAAHFLCNATKGDREWVARAG